MCINPSEIVIDRGPNGMRVPVPCRSCWRCKQNRVNDYVGRALCEASTSIATCAITLTYAPRDDLADKLLQPRHFQLFVKRLRRAGHVVRYLVAGEYGSLRGRAHFHALLFFEAFADQKQCDVPFYRPQHVFDPDASRPFSRDFPQKTLGHVREWPHGHVLVDWSANERAIRYVCKYFFSEDKKNAWLSMSKKPPLGAAFFAQKAQKAIDLGVLPHSFEYLPPGGDRNKPYLLTGASRRDYLNAITQDPSMKKKMSEWVLKTFEKYEKARWIERLNAQSPEYLLAAYLDRQEMLKDNARLAASFNYYHRMKKLDELFEKSENGIIRPEDLSQSDYEDFF